MSRKLFDARIRVMGPDAGGWHWSEGDKVVGTVFRVPAGGVVARREIWSNGFDEPCPPGRDPSWWDPQVCLWLWAEGVLRELNRGTAAKREKVLRSLSSE